MDTSFQMQDFHLTKSLGSGAHGKVDRYSHGIDHVAVKDIYVSDIERYHPSMTEDILGELLMTHGFSDRIVSRLHFEIKKENEQTELFRIVLPCGVPVSKTTFSDQQELFVVEECLRMLGDLKSHGLAHFDIKPTNMILLNNKIVLVDGGSCFMAWENVFSSNDLYTIWYRSPELFREGNKIYPEKNYFAGDVWAMGCTLYELTQHTPLFPGKSDLETYNMINRSNLIFTNNNTLDITKKIIRACLTMNYKKRPSVEELWKMFSLKSEYLDTKVYVTNRHHNLLLKKKNCGDKIQRIKVVELLLKIIIQFSIPCEVYFVTLDIFDKYMDVYGNGDNYNILNISLFVALNFLRIHNKMDLSLFIDANDDNFQDIKIKMISLINIYPITKFHIIMNQIKNRSKIYLSKTLSFYLLVLLSTSRKFNTIFFKFSCDDIKKLVDKCAYNVFDLKFWITFKTQNSNLLSKLKSLYTKHPTINSYFSPHTIFIVKNELFPEPIV